MLKHLKSQKGFTLIELLVVIAILGVLAAVVMPNVSKFIGRGNLEAANTEYSNVVLAVTAYQAENNGTVPADTSMVSNYLTGVLKGTYSIASGGNVTGVTYPNLTWDAATQRWK